MLTKCNYAIRTDSHSQRYLWESRFDFSGFYLCQGVSVYISICLFVSYHDYTKTILPIFIKFGGKVAHRQERIRFWWIVLH